MAEQTAPGELAHGIFPFHGGITRRALQDVVGGGFGADDEVETGCSRWNHHYLQDSKRCPLIKGAFEADPLQMVVMRSCYEQETTAV